MLLNFYIANSTILYFWEVLESIHKLIIKLHVLQCLFVRGSNKCKGWVVLFKTSQKERLFHILWQPSTLEDNLTMWSPFLHPSKKDISLSVWARREYICKLNWNESLQICFENYQYFPCSHWQSRNRIMNTFIIVNITLPPYVIDSLKDKSMLVHLKKAFPLTLLAWALI